MLLGIHGVTIMHTNLLTDIQIAKEAGYDALEVFSPKLERYLAAGGRLEELVAALGSLRVATISPIYGIERQEPEERRALRLRCERLSAAARALGCPAIQVIALDALQSQAWSEMRDKIARSLAELADIASQYGVRLALEPVAVAPLRKLAPALEVLDAAGRANVGLVVDTFHIWAGGTTWEEVARLDRRLILGAHLGEATRPQGQEWTDDDRAALLGDGILPLREGIAAIRATGYDGVWTVELWSPYHWEWDPVLIAREMRRRALALLAA